MWTLPKKSGFLPTTSSQRIKSLYRREKHPKAKLRLLAAIHRKQGKSIDEIAYLLSTPRDTVYGWLRRFVKRGIDAKDSIKQPGRPAELTIKQRQELVSKLERGPPHNPTGLWTSKEIRALIAKKYKRTYVKQHIWRMLTSLGYTMQRPRKQHFQRPEKKVIQQFKKKLDEKQDTIVRKDLWWAHKMKQPSGSSRS